MKPQTLPSTSDILASALRRTIRLYVTTQFKALNKIDFVQVILLKNSYFTCLLYHSNLTNFSCFYYNTSSWHMLISTSVFLQVPAHSTSYNKIQEQQKHCI